MCDVNFEYQGEVLKSFFPNPFAQLPLLKRDRGIELVSWGRREEQDGKLPVTGWAGLDSIHSGGGISISLSLYAYLLYAIWKRTLKVLVNGMT